MNEIQCSIEQLRHDLVTTQCDLIVKEYDTCDIEKSVDCEVIWKRSLTDHYAQQPRTEPSLNTVIPCDHPETEKCAPPPSAATSFKTHEDRFCAFLIEQDDTKIDDHPQCDESLSKAPEQTSLFSSIVPLPKALIKRLCPTIVVNNNKKYKFKKLCQHCGHYL